MTSSVDFWLCGPLRMRTNGIALLRPNLVHELLALLLLRANSPVPIPVIAHDLWPDRTGAGESDIRPMITKVRRLVTPLDIAVTAQGGKFSLQVDPMRVDLLRFAGLMAEADRLTDPTEQRWLVDEAMGLCANRLLLTGFNHPWVRAEREKFERAWDEARLRRNHHWLRDGKHAQLVSTLQREGILLADQAAATDFLTAMYRDGQAAEATNVFEALSRALAKENIQVRSKLARVGESIRRRDPSLDQPDVRQLATVPEMVQPPMGTLDGRRADLDRMRRHAETERHHTIRVVGIFGAPGIGKTALAVGYAWANRQRYSGGNLFADFGGYGGQTGIDLDQILLSFLANLGASVDRLPVERAGRLQQYRELIRGHQLLIVLDNVQATQDIQPLLPTEPGSLVIVTSRKRLTDLTVRYRALPVILEPLDESAATTLLTRFVGGRADYDATVVADIAMTCNGHPLALCLAGARIATRPEEPLASVAAALAQPGNRISVLDLYAEAGGAVRDVFSWSYQLLDPVPAQVFRAFGWSASGRLDLPSLGALTRLGDDVLTESLSDLMAVHLVTSATDQRYAMSDLLAEYAAALADLAGEVGAREAALDRLYAHHLHTATAAAHCLWPTEVAAWPAGIDFVSPAVAGRWLESNREDMLTAARHVEGAARPRHLIALSGCLFRYLDHGGHLDDAAWLNGAAVQAAQAMGDDRATATALNRLGAVIIRRGQLDEAEAAHVRAHALFLDLNDPRGQAIALGNLGRLAARRSRFDQALAHHRDALALFRLAGDALGQARTLTNLGVVHEARGDLAAALRDHVEARQICTMIDAPDATARALASVAGVLRAQGRLEEAAQKLTEALEQFRVLGDRLGVAITLTNLGMVLAIQDRPADAADLHEQALCEFEAIGDEANAVETLNNLGIALLSAGRPTAALIRHHDALRRTSTHNRTETARAHASLAAAHWAEAQRSAGSARASELLLGEQYLKSARILYRELDVQPPANLDLIDLPSAD